MSELGRVAAAAWGQVLGRTGQMQGRTLRFMSSSALPREITKAASLSFRICGVNGAPREAALFHYFLSPTARNQSRKAIYLEESAFRLKEYGWCWI